MSGLPSPTQPWLGPPSPALRALRERVLSVERRIRVLPLVLGIASTVEAAEPPAGALSCSGCHPASAKVESPVPPIRGRDPAAIVTAMLAFRSGERPSTVMGRLAKGFSDEETRAIATWLAMQH